MIDSELLGTIITVAGALGGSFIGTAGALKLNSYRLTQLESRLEKGEVKNDKEHDEIFGKINRHGEDIAVLKVKEGL